MCENNDSNSLYIALTDHKTPVPHSLSLSFSLSFFSLSLSLHLFYINAVYIIIYTTIWLKQEIESLKVYFIRFDICYNFYACFSFVL